MRIVIQRVTQASVTIDEKVKASIGKGYLILLGIEERDGQEDIDWLVKKVINLRVTVQAGSGLLNTRFQFLYMNNSAINWLWNPT